MDELADEIMKVTAEKLAKKKTEDNYDEGGPETRTTHVLIDKLYFFKRGIHVI